MKYNASSLDLFPLLEIALQEPNGAAAAFDVFERDLARLGFAFGFARAAFRR